MSVNVECVLELRAVPNASRNQVVGWQGTALKVKVMAPPEGGRANQEIIELLSATLGVPRRAVEIVQGESSRNKRVRIAGLSAAQVRTTLAPASKKDA